MIVDPFRWYRRRQRLLKEAREECQLLRRRHGEGAAAAARAKLERPDLTSWGRRVMEETIRLLETQPEAGAKKAAASQQPPLAF